MGEVSAKQADDVWAWCDVGCVFPDGPMRVKGANNEYVAVWYKHGKPVTGRAWNDGGKMKASFKDPFQNKELFEHRDLKGKIQILTYDNLKEDAENWRTFGFWYQWLPWGEARKQPNSALVRCGDSGVILVPGPDGQSYCGNMEISSETATVAVGGKCVTKKGPEVQGYLTLLRNFVNPGVPPPEPVDLDDRWIDLKEGDSWDKVRKVHIPALGGAQLKGRSGAEATPSVVLWYMCGQPVMGAMWEANGKIQCAFGWNSNEYRQNIGNIQVLVYNPSVAAFKISWQTYATATKPGSGWRPVKVTHSGVDCAPCVIEKDGKQHLGKVIVSQEKASFPDHGKEVVMVGPPVQQCMVLCRDK